VSARLLIIVAALAWALPAAGAPQSRAQQRCLNALNAAGLRVATVVSQRALGCVARALHGRQTVAACLAADPGGRVGRATAKTTRIEARFCATHPDFGASAAAAVNAAALGAGWIRDLFGDDPDAALGTARRGSRACQVGAAKSVARVLLARLRGFGACARAGLKAGTITDASTLAGCYGSDRGGGIARAERALERTVTRKCRDVDVAAAAPGRCASATPATLAACLTPEADCAACRTATAADAFFRSCHRYADGVATFYCGARPTTARSVARQWDEEALAAVRVDFPRPPIHARNLFHLATAMWDAWAAYDATARGYIVTEKVTSADPAADRAVALSFAAYRLLAARYAISPNAAKSALAFAVRMDALGLDTGYTGTVGTNAAALGNRVGAAVLAYGLNDGSNEAANYADPTYAPVNDPLVVKLPGTVMNDPNRWQPLALDSQIGQNGIPIPGQIQVFVAPQWGSVLAFAADFATLLPGPPPRLRESTDAAFKQAALDVLERASELTPDDGAMMDISPASYGNNPLGTNDGTGYPVNPVSGLPYAPQVARRGDFGRVIAEFWADGPTSETPPGHWNVLANYVSDHLAEKRIGGTGPIVDDLEWDVKAYLAINAATHDAAIGCWGTKRVYDSVRPISMIRYMGGLGQSSDPMGPSYHPDGLPIVPGRVEVITPASSAPGERHADLAEFVGEVAVLSWPGAPGDPKTQHSGVRWLRAKTWSPYQRDTFVTPAFASYTSGHSTFSRAAAEVLARITGSPYFPGGLGEFTVKANAFLQFETGPSQDLTLQWATYYDASDQAGQSRIWGGIHILADDFGGRTMGSTIGIAAYAKALTYFAGTAAP
jgi:hypothetical protein